MNPYKEVFLRNLDESTLSRVWQHATGANAFVMMTAFRKGRDYDFNVQKNITLADMIHNLKYGHFWLEGYFEEKNKDGSTVRVVEDSLFILGPSDKQKSELFKKQMLDLGKHFDQDSIFFKPAGEDKGYILSCADGSVVLGPLSLNPDKMGNYYSQLKHGSHAGKKFTFENAGTGRNNVDRWVNKLRLFP